MFGSLCKSVRKLWIGDSELSDSGLLGDLVSQAPGSAGLIFQDYPGFYA